MEEKDILKHVRSCIEQLCSKFIDNPTYFLSFKEQDLVAYLYHLICTNFYFLEEISYINGFGKKVRTKLIETQTPADGRKTFDLTITNPNWKGKSEKELLIAVEFKWKPYSGKTTIDQIKYDIDKLNNNSDDIKHAFMLVFNSDRKFTQEFKDKIKWYNKNPTLEIIFVERK